VLEAEGGVGVEHRRAGIEARQIDVAVLEGQRLVVNVAGPEIPTTHLGTGGPDQLDGARLGVGGLRPHPHAAGLQRHVYVFFVHAGLPAAGVWTVGLVRLFAVVDRLLVARARRPAWIGVEHDPKSVQFGKGLGDLGQNQRRVVALPSNRFFQRHDPGPHRQDVGLNILQGIDRLKAGRCPFGADIDVRQGTGGLSDCNKPAPSLCMS